jgi:hypothetical protein
VKGVTDTRIRTPHPPTRNKISKKIRFIKNLVNTAIALMCLAQRFLFILNRFKTNKNTAIYFFYVLEACLSRGKRRISYSQDSLNSDRIPWIPIGFPGFASDFLDSLDFHRIPGILIRFPGFPSYSQGIGIPGIRRFPLGRTGQKRIDSTSE